ncbi:protoporphyrinogen/coproporphyrinogen oxidase [Microbacterium arabinogalactanolyticum]|uniref:protoporphyrinogen/coproporphyrinogen oxidase n=1 Tax=Microbacterium arabinogalactanolyticum TaxID=69365 RepID=UPI0025521F56|nr:FAD-dependent oxidoreductase [Microbacterium arabinogalactanolyticum]GLC86611.1 protoporphyrinogen oxidase HemY' [Microbacterium arabinogalactanolyticum]
MSSEHPVDIAARAAEQHVVVIGGGIGGLVAARECAKVGMRVTLLEAEEQLGGSIRTAELDGIIVDAGAESFATRGGHVRALVDELGLSDAVAPPEGGGAWLSGIPGAPDAPLPKGGLLGIPANPFQEDVRAIIGWRGVWRAYLDRLRPPLTIGHQQSLGRLVTTRMGARVRDRLVAPVTAGVYSALPEDVDVEIAAPGLSAALTRVGSLSGAVLALQGDRAGKTPGAAVLGIDGGMGRIVDALRDELALFGADVRTGTRAVRLDRSGEGWTVAFEELGTVAADASEPDVVEPDAVRGDDALVSPDVPAPDAPATDAPEPLTATAVVIATAEPSARTLLAPHMTGLSDPGAAPEIEIVTLLLDAPELDSAPRGSGVLTVPGSHTAKALTHSTAKWGWLRRAAGGRHVVRVSFGTQGEAAATAPLDDDAAARLALSEASALLGVRLRPEQLRASHRARFVQSQPTSLIGATERRAAVREAVRNTPRLAVVGAWLAGTGLAQVVPDAAEEADRLRSQLLWDR